MFALILVLSASFAEEISQSIGKQSVKLRRESVYNLGFLELFWGFVVMSGIALFGPHNHFDPASLPTLLPRLVLEVTVAYLTVEAIVQADRSTIGFLRLLSIPLLLVVDIVLGYRLTLVQIAGVVIMFFALTLAFHHNPSGKKGAWLVVLSAFLSVGTVSLYKYDITHYNSVAIEQSIVLGTILAFFYLRGWRGRSPFKLLLRPLSGTQALMSGLGSVLGSFAISFAPASVVVALRRTFALFWAVIFGQAYFHEHSLKRKAYSFGFTVVGIALLVSPYWHWRH